MSALNHYDQENEGNNFKILPRTELFSRVERKAKKILLMPSAKCPDLKVGLEMGKIDRKETEIHVYEIIPNVMNQIKKVCTGLKLKNVKYFQQDILTVQELDYDYDLIYLDLCGQMTNKVYDFLEKNRLQFIFCPVVGMTYELRIRSNSLFKSDSYRSSLDNKIRLYPWITRPNYQKQPMTLGNTDSKETGETESTTRLHWTVAKTLMALGLNARGKAIDFCMMYNAGTPMVTFIFNPKKGIVIGDWILKSRKEYGKNYQAEKIKRINNPVPIQAINMQTLEELQAEYDRLCSLPKNHANAGLKRSITCKMQKLQLV